MSHPIFANKHQEEQEKIDKVIRLIKFDPASAGFPEIAQPGRGSDIEVTIERDKISENQFHIKFRFVTTPGCQTLFRELKIIDGTRLSRLAQIYNENKDMIELGLAERENSQCSPG